MKNIFKTVLFAALFIAAGNNAFAQFGVNVGYMNSTTWGKANGSKSSEDMTTNGFAVGIDHNIKLIGNLLSIQPGIYYQHLLKSEDIAEFPGYAARNTFTENYIGIPVHVKVGFNILPKEMLRIYVFAGPTFEIGLMANDKISISGNDRSGEVSYNYYNGKLKSTSDVLNSLIENYYPSDSQGQYKRFDVMLGGGVGIQAVHFLDIRAGYDYGVVNRLKGTYAENMTANRGQFYVSVGIRL